MASDLPHQLPAANKTLTAQCLCKAVHFTITLPTSALPLPVHLCHCHICRYTHGTLCVFHAALPAHITPTFIAPSSIESSLTSYIHGPSAASERLFCTTCGCHIGDRDLIPSPSSGIAEWRVATSIFDQHTPSTFQIRSHAFTRGGTAPGLHQWLPTLGARTLNHWDPEPGSTTFPIPPPPPPQPELDPNGNERLRAECHCGGVSFTLPRPYVPGIADDAVLSRYVSREDPRKWLACLDVCDDCRLVDGTHVVGWTFVPLAQLEPTIPADLKFGTMTTFRSSEDVVRTFCGVCGATVFFSCESRTDREDGGRRTVVDVAVGLLRAPEGATAEKWLTWRTGRLAWRESGMRYDGEFTESLEKGLREWGVKRDGKVLGFSIPYED
ncbi:glutathione-dependent formaldehyde-activating enzyme [Podospora appendiculata]|uniref:Glutathione-dependent formaldehyde-activating enzyme n=1 Tax=Podospora appendiculata TaxID=314037 RepID=A0AAE0XAG6_9PEZI|nr:glutathione-dependent formaldehyde-activating enzyme [Podospora appendiculata]